MKKFKLLSLLLIVSLFVTVLPVPALALTEPELWGMYATAMDTGTGELLYNKGGDQPVELGGMTFLMTALLTGEAADRQDIYLDDAVFVSETVGYNLTEASVLSEPAIAAGETLTVEDLLYLMLFRGAQDAANVLAEYVGGSIDAFVASMNSRAAELGCTGTNFMNANGVQTTGHFTTCGDIARIARAAFENATLRPIFQASGHTTAPTEQNGSRSVTNPNALRDDASGMKYEYCTAGLPVMMPMGMGIVAAATYNEISVIAVSVGCVDDASRCSDASTLFRWTYENFAFQTVLSSTDILATVPVEMGDPEAVGVRAETAIRVLRANDQPLGEITHEITYSHEAEGRTLTAPVEVGMYLGDVTVYMDGVNYGTSRLVAASAVEVSRSQYLHSQLEILTQSESVRQIIKILIIVLGVYLLLVCFYLLQRLRHLHSLRKARKARARSRSQQEIEWLDLPDETSDRPPVSGGYFRREEPAPEEDYAPPAPAPEEYPQDDRPETAEDYDQQMPADQDEEFYDDEPDQYADQDGEVYDDEPDQYDGEDGEVYDDQPDQYDDQAGETYDQDDGYDDDGGRDGFRF